MNYIEEYIPSNEEINILKNNNLAIETRNILYKILKYIDDLLK
jgi:hypothetical protein